MKNKYILTRLQILIMSPSFVPILTFILLTTYKILFDSPILCDNTDLQILYDLKRKG